MKGIYEKGVISNRKIREELIMEQIINNLQNEGNKIVTSMTQGIQKISDFFKMVYRRMKWKNLSILLFFLAGFGYGIYTASSEIYVQVKHWMNVQEVNTQKKAYSNYNKVQVVINPGETAWSIQRQLTPNEHNLQDAITLTTGLNKGIDFGHLQPGQIVYFVKAK